jgi:hypothetical protein
MAGVMSYRFQLQLKDIEKFDFVSNALPTGTWSCLNGDWTMTVPLIRNPPSKQPNLEISISPEIFKNHV